MHLQGIDGVRVHILHSPLRTRHERPFRPFPPGHVIDHQPDAALELGRVRAGGGGDGVEDLLEPILIPGDLGPVRGDMSVGYAYPDGAAVTDREVDDGDAIVVGEVNALAGEFVVQGLVGRGGSGGCGGGSGGGGGGGGGSDEGGGLGESEGEKGSHGRGMESTLFLACLQLRKREYESSSSVPCYVPYR